MVVERRYSDFLELKSHLKAAGMERFSDVFPGKASDLTGGRQAALEAWLRRVVDTHSEFDENVAKFLSASSYL